MVGGDHNKELNDSTKTDFLTKRSKGTPFIKMQRKNRLMLDKRNIGKSIHIGFPYDGRYYIYPHDTIMNEILATRNVGNTRSWIDNGRYHWREPPKWAQELLEPFEVTKPQ